MKKLTTCWLFALAISFAACQKDEEADPKPVVELSVKEATMQATVGETISLKAEVKNNVAVQHAWSINGVAHSTTPDFTFTPDKAGSYTILYTATNASGKYEQQLIVTVAAVPTAYVSRLISYVPAPGQNINQSSGNPESPKSILGQKGFVNLGAWGGYIELGFDHQVKNQEGKPDIIVYGNAMSNFAEPGVVWVMQDANKNGQPDDTWYELAGSEYGKTGYKRKYSITYTRPATAADNVTWADNLGNTGIIRKNEYHTQSYYPEWIKDNTYTLTGSLLPASNISSGTGTRTSTPFAFGYADNTPGGDELDIANAIDENGNKVTLTGIDFIRIQTGIQADLGAVGELSTEVAGVADLSLLN
ncbi:PKD-like domain-containing protein [Pontibacter arcticus]|uniref:Cell surface protein n=1 Tax=Pontibacter arcticus TaxID=2080288 RepID=A0A364RIJ1_9BACT|nr:PKD-like domain-containing protein [Pontibacter arcticus]RAU84160.1 cell surface protein [Pontibacter arcticus]